MQRQTEQHERIGRYWNRYREAMPGIAEAYDALPQEAYAGGRLEAKTKRIIALAIAVVSGCRACMLFQTNHALRLGADAEEILEACGVAISIGGTMAAGETARVVEFLQERGVLASGGSRE